MSKNQFISIALFCILLAHSNILNAQNELDNTYKKNSIHGSVGTILFVSSANVFYERILSESTNQSRFTTFARVGIHGFHAVNIWGGGDTNSSAFVVQGGILTGQNRSHLEAALGVGYIMSTETTLIPAFALGYRNQITGKNFMFRVGVGFPEFIYLGLGYSF